jgi:threonine 3-dehydrogenase
MKAIGKLKKEKGVWLYDAPMPKVGLTDVLVKVVKTAICGSDIAIYNWNEWAQKTIPVPMTIGHEFIGIIEDVGSEVTKNLKIGDRVSGEGHITCGICRSCRAGTRHLCPKTIGIGVHVNGCFAEYVTIPCDNVIKVPDNISDDIASIFDPLGNAVHTALSFDLVGEDVLITGAGPIGIMAANIAKHVGARNVIITEMNPYRLSLAKTTNATKIVDVSTSNLQDIMKEHDINEGFSVGLEMSGNPTALNSMINNMSSGGKIALLGILPNGAGIDWVEVVFRSLRIKGIYGREMFETWYKMMNMLQNGLDITNVITHTYKANEYEKAFNMLLEGNAGKVLLDWS